jgi:hypothetical protein
MNVMCKTCRVGLEVLTAVSTKVAVSWVVAPCSLAEVYQRFRGPCCLHHQGDETCRICSENEKNVRLYNLDWKSVGEDTA